MICQWCGRRCGSVGPGTVPLNDDRIGRALGALAEQADAVVGSIGTTAITVFGIDTAQLHWDMTSISLHGAYEQADSDYATPNFGNPKDSRTDLKQIQTGLAVTAGRRRPAARPCL